MWTWYLILLYSFRGYWSSDSRGPWGVDQLRCWPMGDISALLPPAIWQNGIRHHRHNRYLRCAKTQRSVFFNCLSFWTIIGYFTSRWLWTSERGFFLTSKLRFERGMWISRRWEPICRYGWTGYSVKSQTWKPLAWKKYHLLSRLSLWTPLELGLPWRVKCYGVFSMYFRGLFYYVCFIRLCRC